MGHIDVVRTYDVSSGHHSHDSLKHRLTGENKPSVFLVDRLWPRGISKTDLPHDVWLPDVGPSTELRKWFDHDPEKFDEFVQRYHVELDDHRDEANVLVIAAKDRNIVLLYSAKDDKHNQAVALRRWINQKR